MHLKSFEVVQNVLTFLIIPFLGIIVGIASIPGVWMFLEARAYLVDQANSVSYTHLTLPTNREV